MPNFQRIMDKLSNALDILDFSFLISGGTTFGIVYTYLSYVQNIQVTLIHKGFIGVCCILLIAYVCGLFSWSIGKYIRRTFFLKSSGKSANKSNEDHCFENLFETIHKKISKTATPSEEGSTNSTIKYPFTDNTLNYTYMWNKIAQSKDEEVQERYNFINKYWVMQAIFEGLIGSAMIGIILSLSFIFPLNLLSLFAISFFIITIIIYPIIFPFFVITLAISIIFPFLYTYMNLSIPPKIYYAIGALIAFIILLLRSAVEARKNAEVQIKEVVIAYYLFFIEPKNITE